MACYSICTRKWLRALMPWVWITFFRPNIHSFLWGGYPIHLVFRNCIAVPNLRMWELFTEFKIHHLLLRYLGLYIGNFQSYVLITIFSSKKTRLIIFFSIMEEDFSLLWKAFRSFRCGTIKYLKTRIFLRKTSLDPFKPIDAQHKTLPSCI